MNYYIKIALTLLAGLIGIAGVFLLVALSPLVLN